MGRGIQKDGMSCTSFQHTHLPSLTLGSLALAIWLPYMRSSKGLKLHVCVWWGRSSLGVRHEICLTLLPHSLNQFSLSLYCAPSGASSTLFLEVYLPFFSHMGLAHSLVSWNVSTSVLLSDELKWNLIIPAKLSCDSVTWIKSTDSRLDCKHQINFTAKVRLLSWLSVLLEG